MRIFATKFTKITVTTEIFVKMPKERKHVKIEAPNQGVAPNDWPEVYDNILEMRKDKTAPVDTMGCEKVSEMSNDPKVQRFHCLVSLMLSSQTKVFYQFFPHGLFF